MTHVHHDSVEVRDGSGGPVMGFMLGIVGLVVVLIIAFAVLWARPWDDNGGGTTIDTPITQPIDVVPSDGGTTGGDPAPTQ